jgi:DMSO/TMAO reductase YedYZ molybdopterin-dependent catalytic subunit
MSSIWNRRGFLKKSALASLTGLLGTEIAFANKLPKKYLPILIQQEDILPGKHQDMIILNNRPWNIEAPAHLLNDAITPADKMFVRNNGISPSVIDESNWQLTIDGESAEKTITYSIADLKKKFPHYSYQLTLECGGNGRAGFNPPASGNQWTEGAVSCGKWTGVRLKDVLQDTGIKTDAVYIGYYGMDTHLSGDDSLSAISRGVPISKALEDESLIAWALNDEEIPVMNGHPLRLVIGGWPASTSGKWLKRIAIRNSVHDGEKMEGMSYKVPKNPVAPGEKVAEEDFKIIESMPVKSLITYPKSGAIIGEGTSLKVNGHAWAGDLEVNEIDISIDFGATWQKCNLKAPVNRLAWQQWSTELKFTQKGYYEIWAKAIDSKGNAQPMVIPGWNPKGYLNNACHRIAVKVQ